MKIFIFKYLISFIIFVTGSVVFASSYVSLSPVTTEIIYALGADKNLTGVSSTCNYPVEVKEKPVIGDTYFINMEMLIAAKPDYLFAMSSSKPKLGELNLTKTKPIYFEFTKIEEIYDAIRLIASLTDTQKNAEKVIKNIKENINKYRTDKPKRILYIVQTNPLITIGGKSFITDIIKKSGHISVTEDIPYYYPNITLEYILKTNPDVIVICYAAEMREIKTLFPNTKIMYLNSAQRDIINRSGPRVYEAVRLFSKLEFDEEPTR